MPFNETLEKEDLLLFANKVIEKLSDSRHAEKHYQSFIRKKNTKLVKESQITTCQPKAFENQTLLIQNQLLQNILKLHINYPRLKDKLKR